MECGFFVGYHIALFNRIISMLPCSSLRQIEVLVKERGHSYRFAAYQNDVLSRLEYLLEVYKQSKEAVFAPVWEWDSENEACRDVVTNVEEDQMQVHKEQQKGSTRKEMKREQCDDLNDRPLKRTATDVQAQGFFDKSPEGQTCRSPDGAGQVQSCYNRKSIHGGH